MSETSSGPISINMPVPVSTLVDPATGVPTKPWWYLINRLVTRTGGPVGVDSATVQAAVAQAEADAAAALAVATQALMEDDDTFAVAMPQVHSLQVALALSDTPDHVDTDSIILLSLALQDESP